MSDTSISDLSWYVVSDYCIWGKPPFTVSTKKQVKISDSPPPPPPPPPPPLDTVCIHSCLLETIFHQCQEPMK